MSAAHESSRNEGVIATTGLTRDEDVVLGAQLRQFSKAPSINMPINPTPLWRNCAEVSLHLLSNKMTTNG
jgi:hypothetical protein